MKSKMKKILAVLLMVCLVVPSIPSRVAEATESNSELALEKFITNTGYNNKTGDMDKTVKSRMGTETYLFHTKFQTTSETMGSFGSNNNPYMQVTYLGWRSNEEQYYIGLYKEDGSVWKIKFHRGDTDYKAEHFISEYTLSEEQISQLTGNGLDFYLVNSATTTFTVYVEEEGVVEMAGNIVSPTNNKQVYEVKHSSKDTAATFITTGYFYGTEYTRATAAQELLNQQWSDSEGQIYEEFISHTGCATTTGKALDSIKSRMGAAAYLFHTKFQTTSETMESFDTAKNPYMRVSYLGYGTSDEQYYIGLYKEDGDVWKIKFHRGDNEYWAEHAISEYTLSEEQISQLTGNGLDFYLVNSATTTFTVYVEEEGVVEMAGNIVSPTNNKQVYEVKHSSIDTAATFITTGCFYGQGYTRATAAQKLLQSIVIPGVEKPSEFTINGLNESYTLGDIVQFSVSNEEQYGVEAVKINNVVVAPKEDGIYEYRVTIADLDGILIEVNGSEKMVEEFIELTETADFGTDFGKTSYKESTIVETMQDGMKFIYHTKVRNPLDGTSEYGPYIKCSGYGSKWEVFYIHIRKKDDTRWYFYLESSRAGKEYDPEINKQYLTDEQLNAIRRDGLDLYLVRTGTADYAVYMGNDTLSGVELLGNFTSSEIKTNQIYQIEQKRTDGAVVGYFYQGYTAKEAVELLWNTSVTPTTNTENAKIEGTESNYTLGEKVTFTATADAGYAVTSVTLNGKELPLDANGTYSFIVKMEHTKECKIVVTAKATTITEYKTLNEFSSNNTKNEFNDSIAIMNTNHVLHSKFKLTKNELQNVQQSDKGIYVKCDGYGTKWEAYTLSLKYVSNKWCLVVNRNNEKTWSKDLLSYELSSEQIEKITEDGFDVFITHTSSETKYVVYVEKGENVECVYTINSEVDNGKIYSITHSNATMITSSLYLYGEGFTTGEKVSNVLLNEEIRVNYGELQNASIHGLKAVYHAGDKVSFSVKADANYVVTSVSFNGEVLIADADGVYHFYLTYSHLDNCTVSIVVASASVEQFVECIGTSTIDMGDRYNPFVFHTTIKGDTIYDENGAIINYGDDGKDVNAYAKLDFSGYGTTGESLSLRLYVTGKTTSRFQLGAYYGNAEPEKQWREVSYTLSEEQLHKITTSGLNIFLVSTAGSADSNGTTPLTVALYVENANSSGVTKACELTMQHATRLYSVKHTTKTGATLETTGSTYTADSSENVAEALFEQAYFIKGDSNDDGVFDVRDLIRTKRYQEKATAKIHVQCADLDENNLITDNDVLSSREVLVNEAEAEAIAYYDGLSSRGGDDYKIMNTSLFYRNNKWDRDRTSIYGADPSVMEITKSGDKNYGKFIMMVTGNSTDQSIPVYIGTDLVNWKRTGNITIVKENGESAANVATSDLWAMEMIYDKTTDRYYLFFSATPTTDSEIKEVPYVAVGDSYTGDFKLINHSDYKYADNTALTSTVGTDALGYASYLKYSVFDPYQMGQALKMAELINNPAAKPFQAIDLHPFVASNGDKYLYFSITSITDKQVILGIKMSDWSTPQYDTLTVLTEVKKDQVSNGSSVQYEKRYINEGPWMTEHNEKFYLTFSTNSYVKDNYKVIQAVADSPLGAFRKLSVEEGGILLGADRIGEISGPGHHSLIEKNGELYIVYHVHDDPAAPSSKRHIVMNKVEWVTKANGLEVMYVNGPTLASIQPLPEFATGYKNIASVANVNATNLKVDNEVSRLTDKVWNSKGSTWSSGNYDRSKTFFGDTVAKDVEFNGETTITMNFAEAKTIRALMIYNSSDINKAFDEIERIEFVCADGSKKYINHLGFDFIANTYTLAAYQGETTGTEEFICGASVAEFNELQVTEIRITVKPGTEKSYVALGEIVVLGKN